MFDRKKFIKANKITILFIILTITIMFVPFVYSRFLSEVESDSKLETAFYILDSDYYGATINLGAITPREEPYIYNFAISNHNETDRLEVEMKYSLKIITTTNLPLTYELYMNGDNENSIIISDENILDEHDTYFKEIKTNDIILGFEEDETNEYELYVYFDEQYDNFEYQDIVELVDIKIESNQILESE